MPTLRALIVSAILITAQCAPTSHTASKGKRFSKGPPGASGKLLGTEEWLGYSPDEKITKESTVIEEADFELAPGQTEDPDLGLFLNPEGVKNFQPIRGSKHAPTDPGPQNAAYQRLNPDLYAPPGTDSGSVPNAHWPLGLSHNRHGTPPEAGYARQQNVADLPAATEMAGVDMRLSPNAYRELHWHDAAEWSLVLNGSARLSAINTDGQTFYDDVQAGDVWLFPSGMPHSIQAKENGVEFLLVFDKGSFSEDSTFLITETFLRIPKAVIAKDLRADVSELSDIPSDMRYIFPGSAVPEDITVQEPGKDGGPNGYIPKEGTYSYHWSQQEPYKVPGGSIKILDSSTFPASKEFSAALLTIDPGASREIHWHTSSDEWNYWISGQGRISVFLAPEDSQTFDFTAGDVGYIPQDNAHYIENTGTEPLVVLEMLKNPKFEDISLAQWLGLTPKQVVRETMHLSDKLLDRLPKIKPYIVPGVGHYDPLATNFTSDPL